MVEQEMVTEAAAVQVGERVLEVTDLSIQFKSEHGWSTVVDHLDLTLERGETLGLVGESGSGKTVTSLAIMGLLTGPRVRISGSVKLQGRELVGLNKREMNALRGKSIGMIFQEPRRSLNPAFTVGHERVLALYSRDCGDALEPAGHPAARAAGGDCGGAGDG